MRSFFWGEEKPVISFITRFKVILISIAIISGIELWVSCLPKPGPYDNNFYEFAYRKKEYVPAGLVFQKLTYLSKLDSDFVSVGDSSGLHGIRSNVVMEHLSGRKFLNMNVTGNAGYSGFRSIARHYLAHHGNANYLVFSFDPYSLPDCRGLNHEESLTASLYYNYLSSFRRIHFPTNSWRLNVTNWVYYRKFIHQLYQSEEGNEWLPEEEKLEQERGWIAIGGAAPDKKECDFRVRNKREEVWTFEHELDAFAKLADEFHVKLIVIPNPVSCDIRTGRYSDLIQKQLDSFALRHPNVYIPFSIINTWQNFYFSSYSHLSNEGADRNSHRIGKALNDLLEGKYSNYYDPDSEAVKNFRRTQHLSGDLQVYDEAYRPIGVRHYENGKLNGITKTFDALGAIISERFYLKDELAWVKFYDFSGKVEREEIFEKNLLKEWLSFMNPYLTWDN